MNDPPSPADQPDFSRADIGIVAAMAMELNHFFDRCEKIRTFKGPQMRFRGGRLEGVRVAAVESGPGMARARRAAESLIDGHQPQWVIAAGFAGALRPGIHVGDLIVPDVIGRDDGDHREIRIDHNMSPGPGLHVGRLVSCPEIVRTAAEKQALAQAHEAIACDMESYAVAEVCRERDIGCMVIRAITDDATADLPQDVASLLTRDGMRRWGAAAGTLWNRPDSAKQMWNLRSAAGKAADRLAPFLAGAIEQLHQVR